MAKRRIFAISCFTEEKNDDENAEDRERDVAIHAPGQRRIGACPGVLGEEAQNDTRGRQNPHGRGQRAGLFCFVTFPPDVVEQDIEDRHGDGGYELPDTKSRDMIREAVSQLRKDARDKMERVAGAQNDRHDAEKPVLPVPPASADHKDAEGDHGDEISDVKNRFSDCHKNSPFAQTAYESVDQFLNQADQVIAGIRLLDFE